jgi:tetratricopeptide (TPR) repeat protein/predicted aspartyl protease
MALVAIGLQCPVASQAQCQANAVNMPVKIVGHHAIATLGIGGTQVPMLVNTGVYFSMLTYAAASQLHLDVVPLPDGFQVSGPPDKIDVGATQIPRIELSDGTMDNINVVVDGYQPAAGAMGILGRDFLGLADTEYDLAHGVIRLVFPNAECATADRATWAEPGTVVSQLALPRPSGETIPLISSTIELNGQKVTAAFDSGGRTLVSLAAAHRVGVADGDMTPDGEGFGLRVGSAKQWLATFDKVDLGSEAIDSEQFEVVDANLPRDMTLGIDFFLSHHIYVSHQQSRMFFTANGGPASALDHGDPGDRDPDGPGDDSLNLDDFGKRTKLELSRGLLRDLVPPVAATSSDVGRDAALAYFDRACALQPANADLVTTRGLFHMVQRQPDLALADLDTALRLNPSHAIARLTRAAVYATQGERDKAQEDLAALDRQLAPQSDGRQTLATQYDELAMPAQALAQWNLWIANHPNDRHVDAAYSSRCWVREQLGAELDQALDDCQKAVAADGKNAGFLSRRGWVYLRMGNPQKALADFDGVIAITPDAAVFSLYGRGLAHLALDETSAAQADLAAARKARPDIDDAIRKDGLPLAPGS